MNYTKQNFTEGQVLKAEHLNHMEDGIAANEAALADKQPKGDYITETVADEKYQPKGDYIPSDTKIPTKTSELTNDSGFVNEAKVDEKIAQAQLGGGEGEEVDLSAYLKETVADGKYQPKGDYLTEHQPLKTINGQSLVGEGDITIEGGEMTVDVPYTELQYIEGTSGQYIDTDYYPEENDSIEVDFKIPSHASSVTGDKYIFNGVKDDNNANRVRLSTYGSNTKYYCQFGSSSNTCTLTSSTFEKEGTFILSKEALVLNGKTILSFSSSYTGVPSYPFRVFGQGNSYARVYAIRVIRDDAVIHNYVPHRQNADGAIGLLDVVTNTFFGNKGETEFIYREVEVPVATLADELVQREQFNGVFATESKDFLLKAGTNDLGESKLFALLSTTKNARCAAINLQDGHTYKISVKNNNPDKTNWRMRIAVWAEAYSSIKFVPAEDEALKLIPPSKGTPAAEILESTYQTTNSYESTYENINNYKTLIIFPAWGIDYDYLDISVIDLSNNALTKDLQVTMDNISDEVREAILKPWDKYTKKPITPHDKLHLTNILTSYMHSHNKATQKILSLAYDFWKHRSEFMYSNGTARDNAWTYWSEEGYYDVNTGNTITAENAGWKKCDCSTFVYYVTAGIGYYSSPYYNTLEGVEVVQGALTGGVETDSDDVTVCRSGPMQIRAGRPHILESNSSSKYYFTGLYGYDADGNLVQTFDTIAIGTTIQPNDNVRYLRAEMKVSSASDYAPAVTTVPRAPATILKRLRIRENEQLEIRGKCPNSQRYAKAMCQWYVDNGYEPVYNIKNYSDMDFPVGSILWWGRTTATSNYRGITHITIYIGGGYLIHCSTGNMGLTGGEGFHIQTMEELFGSYTLPLSGIALPEYITDYSIEKSLYGIK